MSLALGGSTYKDKLIAIHRDKYDDNAVNREEADFYPTMLMQKNKMFT